MDEPDELEEPFSIADAAVSLGVTQTRLRRFLARPEWQGRTRTVTVSTRTGTRTRTVLPMELFDELAVAIWPLDEEIGTERAPKKAKREHYQTVTPTPTRTVSNASDNVSNGGRNVSMEVFQLREDLARVSAERDGLKDRLADTQAERDAWKEQATKDGERLTIALEALQQAQDEMRSRRLIGGREARQVESFETLPELAKKSRGWWPFTRKRNME